MPCVLIADHNSNIHRTVTQALKEIGIDVIAVANGEAAVRKLLELSPDLVLAEIFMPVRSGYEVCEYVKRHPKHAHVPVILLAGAFDPFDEQEAHRVRADGVLKKPFVPPDPLLNMVKTLLAKALSERKEPDKPLVVSRPSSAHPDAPLLAAPQTDVAGGSSQVFSHASEPAIATLTDVLPQAPGSDFAAPEFVPSGLVLPDLDISGFASDVSPSAVSVSHDAPADSLHLPDQPVIDNLAGASPEPVAAPAFWTRANGNHNPLEEIIQEHTFGLEPLEQPEETARRGLDIHPEVGSAVARDANGTSGAAKPTEHSFGVSTFKPMGLMVMDPAVADAAHEELAFIADAPQPILPAEAERPSQSPAALSTFDDSAIANSLTESRDPDTTSYSADSLIEANRSIPADVPALEAAPLIESEYSADPEIAAAPMPELVMESWREPQSESEPDAAESLRSPCVSSNDSQTAEIRFLSLAASESPTAEDVTATPAVNSSTEAPEPQPELGSHVSLDSLPAPIESAPLNESPCPVENDITAIAAANSATASPERPMEGELQPGQFAAPKTNCASMIDDTAARHLQAEPQCKAVAANSAVPEYASLESAPPQSAMSEHPANDEITASTIIPSDVSTSIHESAAEPQSIPYPAVAAAQESTNHEDYIPAQPESNHFAAPNPPDAAELWASLSDPLTAPPDSHPNQRLHESVTAGAIPSVSSSEDEHSPAAKGTSDTTASSVPAMHDHSAAAPSDASDNAPSAVPLDLDTSPAQAHIASTPNPFTAQELESIVTRIVDRIQPRFMESLKHEILRPIIEALVHRELHKH